MAQEEPSWLRREAPLESAVKFLAASSPKFNWVGVYVLRGDELELGPFIGAPTAHTRIPVGRGVCGTAVAENRDQNIPDVRNQGNYLACSAETRSELVALIHEPDSGRVLGQIDIDSHSVGAFGTEEVLMVRRVADTLGKVWRE